LVAFVVAEAFGVIKAIGKESSEVEGRAGMASLKSLTSRPAESALVGWWVRKWMRKYMDKRKKE